MEIEHIRHATTKIRIGDQVLLVDPMFADPGAFPPVPFSPNSVRNPTVALPVPVEDILAEVTAAIVTHLHFDHFDDAARRALPRDTPLIVRKADAAKFREWGFAAVTDVEPGREVRLGNVSVRMDEGPHGWGLMRAVMGSSASAFIRAADESLLVSGDRRSDDAFRAILAETRPGALLVNGGSARLRIGRPISWSSSEIAAVAEAHPDLDIHVVHMDALNHCVESSAQTAARLAGLANVTVHGALRDRRLPG